MESNQYRQQFLPGESTGALSQDPSIEVEETVVVDASMYAPDQVMKPFPNIEKLNGGPITARIIFHILNLSDASFTISFV